MARKALMRWNVILKRWEKMYKGHRLYVVPKTLNCPATKDDSLDAANAWFIARRSEIDGTPPPEPGHDEALTNALNALPDAAAALFSNDQEQSDAALRAILEEYDAQRPTRKAKIEAKVARVTEEMQRLIAEPGPEVERTVGVQFAAWSALVMASKKAHSTKKMKIHRLGFFVEYLGKSADASKIDESRWEGFFVWLIEKPFDDSHKARIQTDARNFVRYLFEKRILDSLPRNLRNSALAFGEKPKAIKVVPVSELRAFLLAATGQTRLHVLLALNCGLSAQDISDLADHQVDWTKGTITRKRSKTGHYDDVPTVCYQLWPETLELLQRYRSGRDTVLLTKSGQPWIQSAFGETYRHSDSIASCFKNICAKTGLQITPRNLRTAASTILGTHSQYKFYAQYFLGHSPKTVADKHYVKPNDAEFFEALQWLRSQLIP